MKTKYLQGTPCRINFISDHGQRNRLRRAALENSRELQHEVYVRIDQSLKVDLILEELNDIKQYLKI